MIETAKRFLWAPALFFVASCGGEPDAGGVPAPAPGETPAAAVDKIGDAPAPDVAGDPKDPTDMPIGETDDDPAPETAADYPELKIETLVEGEGPALAHGEVGMFWYEGLNLDGSRFDTNIGVGKERLQVEVGTGRMFQGDPPQAGGSVIKGWALGLTGMKKGERRKLTIPSDLGYGDRGSPPKIPPFGTLVFYVELDEVVEH